MSTIILNLSQPRRASVDIHPTTAEWRRGLREGKHPMTLAEYVSICNEVGKAVAVLAFTPEAK